MVQAYSDRLLEMVSCESSPALRAYAELMVATAAPVNPQGSTRNNTPSSVPPVLGNVLGNQEAGSAACWTGGAPAGLITRTLPGGWPASALRSGRIAGGSTSRSSPVGSFS